MSILTTMNLTTWSAVLFGQLITQSPLYLVYVLGLLACAVMWRRAPSAALLAMIGTALMLLGTIISSVLPIYLMQSRSAGSSSIGLTMTVFGIANSVLRAIGLAMILAAVFAQRGREASGFAVETTGMNR